MGLEIAFQTATVDPSHYVAFPVQVGQTSVGPLDVFRYLPGMRKRVVELRGVTLAAGAAYGALRVGIVSDDQQPATLGQDAYGYGLLVSGSGAAAKAEIRKGGVAVATHATAAPPSAGTNIGIELDADAGVLRFYWGAVTLSCAIDTSPARRWRVAVYAAQGAVTAATIYNAAISAGGYAYAYGSGADGWNDAPPYRIDATVTEGELLADAQLRFSRALGVWQWGESAYKGVTLSVPIANATGGWDAFINNNVRDMNVSVALDGQAVMTAIADSAAVKDDGQIVVSAVIAAAAAMDQPVGSTIIPLGTPNIAVANTPYPIVLGTAFSLAPKLLDAANLKFAYAAPRWLPGAGATGTPTVTIGRDKGYPLNPGATPPDWTQDGNGGITLARKPDGTFTVDVSIDSASPTKLRDLFRAIVYPAPVGALADIDAACGYTGNLGIAFAQGPTKKQIAQAWVDSVCASFLPLRSGKVSYFRLIDPDTVSPTLILDVQSMLSDLIVAPDRATGLTTQAVGGRNYTTISDFATDASMTPDVLAMLGNDYRFSASYLGPLAPMYEFARGAPPQAFLTSTQADTQRGIDYACGFYRAQRMFASAEVPYDLSHELGNVYRLVYPRYGLTAGVNALVVGVDEDVITGSMTLRLWYAQPYGT